MPRKLVSQLVVSLDGVVESREQWHLSYYNEEMQAAVDSQIVEGDILLLGRTTYEVLAAPLPNRGSDVSLADRINNMPKLVASTTLDTLHWQNSTLIGATSPGSSGASSRRLYWVSICSGHPLVHEFNRRHHRRADLLHSLSARDIETFAQARGPTVHQHRAQERTSSRRSLGAWEQPAHFVNDARARCVCCSRRGEARGGQRRVSPASAAAAPRPT
jgi:RibD C-terminal domain